MERANSAPTPSSPSWRYSSTMAEKTARTAVLGAGILGCCPALALARRGVRVDLYDQTVDPMNGASLHNEGRLHLGFGYANDPHQATHDLMIRGSLSFARIIHELTGAIPADYLPSRPFNYLIPRDIGLSPRKQGFESPRGRQFFKGLAETGAFFGKTSVVCGSGREGAPAPFRVGLFRPGRC